MESHFCIEYLDESSLLEEFTHFDYSDPDSQCNFYSYSNSEDLTTDQLLELFIEETFDGDYITNWRPLNHSNANILLRQMALIKVELNGKKIKSHNSNEAKLCSNILMSFMGNKTEYFTNTDSVNNPHDNPGLVTGYLDGHSEYDSICVIAINRTYLLFLEQSWNYRGE